MILGRYAAKAFKAPAYVGPSHRTASPSSKHLADEVEALLGTGGYEDVLLTRPDALGLHHVYDDVFNPFEPSGRTVLQGLRRVGGDASRNLAKSLLAERSRVGKTASQRDDPRP